MIDFQSSKKHLHYQLLHSHENVDSENDNELFEYYKDLIKMRHNFLHYLSLDCLGKAWEEERSIREIFNLDDDNHMLSRTPDIYLKYEDQNIFIDVSLSYNLHQTEKNKSDKYMIVLNYIKREYNINSQFIHINVRSTLDNLEREINKLNDYMVREFDYKYLNNIVSIVEDKREWISRRINKKFFRESKEREYGDYENYDDLGRYDDLDLEDNVFINFNKNFNQINQIEETVKNFNYDNFYDGLKTSLDDENSDLFVKYKDNELTEEQFDSAKEFIRNDNNMNRKQRNPKPTHHFLCPEPENFDEFPHIRGANSEQKMISQFFQYIENLEDDKKNKNIDKPWFEFILELSKIYNNVFKGKNAVVNKDIFNNGFYDYCNINTKEQYNIERAKTEVYHLRNNKDKYNMKLYRKKVRDVLNMRNDNVKEIVDDISKESKYGDYKINRSYRDYLLDNNYLSNISENAYPIKQKALYIQRSKVTNNFHSIWAKTGIGAFKHKPDVDVWDVRDTIDMDNSKYTQKMIDNLSVSEECLFRDRDFYDGVYSEDSYSFLEMKNEMKNQYMGTYDFLRNTRCYHYLKTSHYICQQLLHHSLMNLKPYSFSFFNCGIPNMVCVVAGCYNLKTSESGKPFIFIVITKNPDYYTPFFGNVKKYPLENNYYLVISNWRRLPTFKLTFMRDSYYSVLSSTMNSIMSLSSRDSFMQIKKYYNIFSTRTIISLCSNQKISELLMDNRYAYMSAFSLYTNIDKLLIDKFGPPYKCSAEVWIVERLFDRLPYIHNSLREGFKFSKPEYYMGQRSKQSLGGLVSIPSLWGDYLLSDIQEVMDEAFIYVHTIKEPSNIFFENVQAIKTILSFQENYNNLKNMYKEGTMLNFEDIKEYLLFNNQIGFSSAIIYKSVIETIEKEKPDFVKYISDINSEPLSELISTKAVISDLEREIVQEDQKLSNRQIEKYFEKIIKYKYGSEDKIPKEEKEEIMNHKSHFLKTNSNYYSERKTRQRVFETILDIVESKPNLDRTVLVANDFIKNDRGKVIADICIKSQYGSKREFYVINMGAKALARCTENFFKKISENSPNEAISIPGDRKTIEMQKMIDRAYMNFPFEDDYKMCFVNGDCTKWSAAETMGSFLSMVYALKNSISKNMYNLLLATFNAWSNKEIQIPMDVYNKVVAPLDDNNIKLHDHNLVENGKIKSTQNFLQGMFNYSSSYKAVCCTNFTISTWKKLYPDSNLHVEHMEHSDDYVLVIIYHNKKELEKFRVLHKIMMRLHGYNDSERKTSCQYIFMEFVSQMSFNGIMIYPQIKKSKEINLNLPCTSYKQDMEAALSRVGECMRVGCNQSFLYFFQRLHVKCIAEAYSILPDMTNNCDRNLKELFNTPIEMFGLPDPLPLLSMYCKGNGNNYRIFTQSNIINRLKVLYLYNLGMSVKEKEDFFYEDEDYGYSIFTPKFMYDSNSKAIRNLRKKIKISYDDLKDFWTNHLSYRLVKPNHVENLITWLKAMFYNRSFIEAYTKSNRTIMTMRISTYVKGKILKIHIEPKDMIEKPKNMITIIDMINYYQDDYFKKYNDLFKEYNNLNKDKKTSLIRVLTKCDPTYSAIYSIIPSLKINMRVLQPKTKLLQIAIKTPHKIKSVDIVNSPGSIIQYIFNKDDFIKDKRNCKSIYSIEKDVELVKDRLPETYFNNKNPMNILSVFNDLSISKEKPNIMMGYNYTTRQLSDSIVDVLTYSLIPFNICTVVYSGLAKVTDPFTGEVLYYKGNKFTPDLYQQILENTCLLYTYMKLKLNKTDTEIRNDLDNVYYYETDERKNVINTRKALEKFTVGYFEQYNTDINIKKIASYLLMSLYNKETLLYNLTENIYNYTYKYTRTANLRGGVYIGDTIVQVTHMNTTFVVIQKRDGNTDPILIFHTDFNKRSLPLYYNIALRLVGKLSEDVFINDMYQNRIKKTIMPFKTNNEFDKFVKKNNITGIFTYYNDKFISREIPAKIVNEELYPLFKSKYPLYKGTGIKSKTKKPFPTINDQKLSVGVGKEKIFTLPFWKCRQYNNLSHSSLKIEDINMVEIFNYNLLYDYINGQIIWREGLSIERNLKNKITLVEDYIKMNRQYNYIFDGLKEKVIDNNYTNQSELLKLVDLMFMEKSDKSEIKPEYYEEKYLRTNLEAKKKESKEEQYINKGTALLDQFYKTVESFGLSDDFMIDDPIDDEMGLLDQEESMVIFREPDDTLQLKDVRSLNLPTLTSSDLYLEKPYKSKVKGFSRQHYLISKIKHLPNLDILYNLQKHINIYSYKTMSMPTYLSTTFSILNMYDNILTNNITDKKINNVFISYLYYFCNNVYIQLSKDDDYWYNINNERVEYMVNVPLPSNIFYKFLSEGKISDGSYVYIKEQDKYIVSRKTNLENYLKSYKNTGKDILVNLYRKGKEEMKILSDLFIMKKDYYEAFF